MLASVAWAQTTVTLTVDMSNEMVSADGVHVAGNFQGWDPGATPMTDNGDGTWSHTFTSDSAATYQYKFINGNAWGVDEQGIPADCAFDGNRQIEVDGMMGEASSSACFNSCNACGVTTVLFRVDMSNEEVSAFGVHIAGDFQGWDPGATELTDADGDMVYEHTHTFEPELTSIEYKFINGNVWSDPNELLDGDCSNGSGNRILELGNEANIVLSANGVGDAYCFNQCSSCVLPLQVTFTVDMSVVSSVSEQGVHIAGTFQGWDAESTMLTDNGDGTWSTTLEVAPGAHEFKFINGAGWNGGEENMNGTSCNAGGNRGAEFDAENNTYEACFNICPGESCLPDPDPANLTFQVDASEVDLAGESMYVFGAFTGWQGGAIEMTDNGDGTWQTTQLVSGSVNVDYKYSIGQPTNDGNDESGSYVLAGDSTTFEAQGCGVGNGFGGYNRRFVRSGMDEVIPLHCYNSCGACLGDAGCTDIDACNYDETAMTDDGSCTYPGDACDDMDETTINDLLNDDCICVGDSAIFGCTDSLSCTYNELATVDDGSCLYLDALDECGGDCFEADSLGNCIETIMYGCLDSLACNFVVDANTEDESCEFPGDSCDDMDENTENDTLNVDCICVGDTIQDSTDFVFEFERLEFGMFPNPTTGEVTLRVDGFHAGVTMQVMDGAGRVVWSEQNLALQGNTVFDLSRLSAGTYNVMLSDERGISVKRLAIQK